MPSIYFYLHFENEYFIDQQILLDIYSDIGRFNGVTSFGQFITNSRLLRSFSLKNACTTAIIIIIILFKNIMYTIKLHSNFLKSILESCRCDFQTNLKKKAQRKFRLRLTLHNDNILAYSAFVPV